MTRGLYKFDIDPADVDPDGLAQAQTPSGAGNLTLNGALISGGTFTEGSGHARQLSVLSAADDTARTLTVTGTDADGRAQTEDIVPANAGTKEGTKYFLTVSSIAIDDGSAGNLSVGTVDELVTKTYPLNRNSDTNWVWQAALTGTMGFTLQVTADNIQQDWTDQETIPWVAYAAKTADFLGSVVAGVTAARIQVTSYSSGAELQTYFSELY